MSKKEMRRVILADQTAIWVSVDKPKDVFGVNKWQLTLVSPNKEDTKVWEDASLKVKEGTDQDGKLEYRTTISRKQFKADGSENDAPRVVDVNKQPWSGPINNHAKVNVIVFEFPYNYMGTKGMSAMLDAVQVIENGTPRVPDVDFSVLDDGIF